MMPSLMLTDWVSALSFCIEHSSINVHIVGAQIYGVEQANWQIMISGVYNHKKLLFLHKNKSLEMGSI